MHKMTLHSEIVVQKMDKCMDLNPSWSLGFYQAYGGSAYTLSYSLSNLDQFLFPCSELLEVN